MIPSLFNRVLKFQHYVGVLAGFPRTSTVTAYALDIL